MLIGVALAWPQLPAQMVSHWGPAGEPNGYMDRFWGVAVGPLLLIGIAALWAMVPRLEPLKDNLKSFLPEFNLLMVAIEVFMTLIFGYSIVYNLGWQLPIAVIILPGMAFLFAVVGWVLPRTKRNWYVGIRTPWTMSSDLVWDKTHSLAGRLFYAAAGVTLLGLVYPTAGLWVAVGSVLAAALTAGVYSYLEFRKLNAAN
jgi:uncharacterized membrane protein